MRINNVIKPEMFNIQLGEEFKHYDEYLIRVPGGWVYIAGQTNIFIPFNNEFNNNELK